MVRLNNRLDDAEAQSATTRRARESLIGLIKPSKYALRFAWRNVPLAFANDAFRRAPEMSGIWLRFASVLRNADQASLYRATLVEAFLSRINRSYWPRRQASERRPWRAAQSHKKLRKSAAKRLKSLARANLCAPHIRAIL